MKYSDIVGRLVIITVAVLIFFVFIEINLRVLGNVFSRKPAIEASGAANTRNIICIGDSFTYGIWVDPSQTYPRQLENKLNQAAPVQRFKVYNFGVPGSNSSQQLKFLGDLLARRRDIYAVILLTGMNDNWNMAGSNIDKVMVEQNVFEKAALKLKIYFADMRIYKMIKIGWLNMRGLSPESNLDFFQIKLKREDVDLHIINRLQEYNLERFMRLTKSYGVKLILTGYPLGSVVEQHVTLKFARSNDIIFVSNIRAFEKRLKTTDFRQLFLHDNAHPTALGYSIMADNLCSAILSAEIRPVGKE